MSIRPGLAMLLAFIFTNATVVVAQPIDPATFLLTDQDLPSGFAAVPDSDKSELVEGASMKLRAYERDGSIIHAVVYAAPTEEVASSLYGQVRDNYVSIGSVWEEIPDLGNEALSTNAFQFAGVIQRVAVFRSGTVMGVVQYNELERLVPPDGAIELARRMVKNGDGT